MKEKKASLAWLVAVLLLVPPFAYVSGYFLRCDFRPAVPGTPPEVSVRFYPTKFEEGIFKPAARWETSITGQWVTVDSIRRKRD